VFSSDPAVVRGFVVGNAEVPAFAQKTDPIVDAGYETVWLTVFGLPVGTPWLMYAEIALPALAVIAICTAVFWLSLLLHGDGSFVPSRTWRGQPHSS